MKMNKTLLLKASAFFLLLITLLLSCGIPTYFYVGTTFNRGGGLSEDTVSGTFTFPDTYGNLSWIDPGTGPSLMLSYIVTTSHDEPSFESLFSSTYKRTSNNGIPVSEDELLSYNSGDYLYRLHRFSDINDNQFNSPTYMAYASNPTSADFKVTLTKDSDNYMVLSITDANESSPPTYPYTYSGSQRLARFEGSAFLDSQPTNTSDYPDYTLLSEPDGLFCHVYAAVNVSQGDFSNNFWTDLKYLGRITL
ncbi:MAG: hypothetical protein EOM32_09670 [Spirochaetia bacterium]|nr:hypothetical protein [Spirochaetia bacterium]NCC90849.1 hypothetical protein [Spirochaetia bacterium]